MRRHLGRATTIGTAAKLLYATLPAACTRCVHLVRAAVPQQLCPQVMRRSVMPQALGRDQAVPHEEPKYPSPPPSPDSDVIASLVTRRRPKQLQELKHTRQNQLQTRPLTVVVPDHSVPVAPGLDHSLSVKSVGQIRPR